MEISDESLIEKQKLIENYKKIADHLLSASDNHFKAAGHLKDGNYEEAAQCAMLAKDYIDLANEAKKEDMEFELKFHMRKHG